MKKFLIIPFVIFYIIGCYTLINHPEVEVYYERESGTDSLAEEYEVFVDEDCSSCHDNFLIQEHFSPMIDKQSVSVNWDNLPWWFDTKYLYLFSEIQSSENTSSDIYQHVQSQQREYGEIPQTGGYLPSGGSSAPSGSAAAKSTENDNHAKKRSNVTNEKSKSRSDSNSETNKRKFRKKR